MHEYLTLKAIANEQREQRNKPHTRQRDAAQVHTTARPKVGLEKKVDQLATTLQQLMNQLQSTPTAASHVTQQAKMGRHNSSVRGITHNQGPAMVRRPCRRSRRQLLEMRRSTASPTAFSREMATKGAVANHLAESVDAAIPRMLCVMVSTTSARLTGSMSPRHM